MRVPTKVANYVCSVARQEITAQVDRRDLHNGMAVRVDTNTRFASCTGTSVRQVPNGITGNRRGVPSSPTGCPFVDTHAILRWM